MSITNEFDLPTRLNDEQSLIKARYCRSILKVAAISTDREARQLIDGLASEQPTVDTSTTVAEAERAALIAIRALAGHQSGTRIPVTSTEWLRAIRAIESWLTTFA